MPRWRPATTEGNFLPACVLADVCWGQVKQHAGVAITVRQAFAIAQAFCCMRTIELCDRRCRSCTQCCCPARRAPWRWLQEVRGRDRGTRPAPAVSATPRRRTLPYLTSCRSALSVSLFLWPTTKTMFACVLVAVSANKDIPQQVSVDDLLRSQGAVYCIQWLIPSQSYFS